MARIVKQYLVSESVATLERVCKLRDSLNSFNNAKIGRHRRGTVFFDGFEAQDNGNGTYLVKLYFGTGRGLFVRIKNVGKFQKYGFADLNKLVRGFARNDLSKKLKVAMA